MQNSKVCKLCFTRRCFSLSAYRLKRSDRPKSKKPPIPVTSRPAPRRSLTPFDKRLPVTAKQVNPQVKGGSVAAMAKVARHDVPEYGYHNPKTGEFVEVKEMIPEFIVPDLTGFKLKPYVPFDAPEVFQSEFTAKDLFKACYSQDILNKMKQGKSKEEILKEVLHRDKDKKATTEG